MTRETENPGRQSWAGKICPTWSWSSCNWIQANAMQSERPKSTISLMQFMNASHRCDPSKRHSNRERLHGSLLVHTNTKLRVWHTHIPCISGPQRMCIHTYTYIQHPRIPLGITLLCDLWMPFEVLCMHMHNFACDVSKLEKKKNYIIWSMSYCAFQTHKVQIKSENPMQELVS